jgi:hypothetical protein
MNHPAITQAIDAIAQHQPAIAQRVTESLSIVLQGVQESPWEDVKWCFSRLTGDGFPVEFTASSSDDEIRYTAEVAGPEVAESDRLALAQKVLDRLGAPALPDEIRSPLEIIQASGTLQYGTWLGVRNSQNPKNRDCYKLYCEVPSVRNNDGDREVEAFMNQIPRLLDCPMTLQMIGYDLSQERLELYLRTDGLELWELEWILRQLETERSTELVTYLEELCDRSVSSLIGGSIGLSVSGSLKQEPSVLALFAPARQWLGRDGEIRSRLLNFTGAASLKTYAALSQPLAHYTEWNTHHGMLSVVVPPIGPLTLHIGLRPPDQITL